MNGINPNALNMPPNGRNNGGDLRTAIIRLIQASPAAPNTYQQTVPVEVRVNNLSQLYTQTRMTQQAQGSPPQTVLQHAARIETQCFRNSTNMEQYNAQVSQYLVRLHQSRLQQNVQNGQNRPNGQQMPPQQPQPQLQPQQPVMLQQAMPMPQNMPVPGQQRFPPGITPQMIQQQQQQQQQQQMQAPQAPMMQMSRSQMQPSQPMMNMMPQGVPQSAPQPVPMQPQASHPGPPQPMMQNNQELNDQDRDRVRDLTSALMRKGNETGEVQRMQNMFNTWPPEKKQQLIMQGITNPVQHHYQKKAIDMIRQQRAQQRAQQQQAAQQQANQQAQHNAMAAHQAGQAMGQPMPNPMMQQIQNPMPQMRINGAPGNLTASNFDFSQLVGQQADAQRALETGDLVVPASNNRMLNGQMGPLSGLPNVGIARPGQGQNVMVPPQQQQNVQQPKKGKVNQTPVQTNAQPPPPNHSKATPVPNPAQVQAQAQAQAQQAQARARQNQPNQGKPMQPQIPGQIIIQSSPATQHQSPALHLLQQPLGQADHTTPQQNMQQTPMLAQAPTPASQNKVMPPQSQPQGPPPNFVQNLPPQARDQLNRMPPDQRQHAIAQWIQQQQPHAMQAIAASQANMGGNAQVNRPMSTVPQAAIPGPAQQNGIPPQQQQQRQVLNIENLPLPKSAIWGKFQISLPEHVKTWRDLKDAIRSNTGLVPEPMREPLLKIQQEQFRQLSERAGPMKGQKPELQQQPIDVSQPQPPPQPQSQPQHQVTMQQLINERVVELGPNNIPRLKEVTNNDLQQYRAKAGPSADKLSEQQLKAFMMKHRRQAVQAKAPHLLQQLDNLVQQRMNVMQGNLQVQQPQPQQPVQSMQLQVPGGGAMPALLTPGIPGSMGNHLQHPSTSPAMNVAQPNFDLKLPNDPRAQAVQQQLQAQVMSHQPPQVPPGMQQPNAEQWQRMLPEQRAKFIMLINNARQKMQNQASGAGAANAQQPRQQSSQQAQQPQPQPQPQLTDKEKNLRFDQLRKEAFESTHLGLPLTLDEETKKQMIQLCANGIQLTKLVEQIIKQYYFKFPAQEDIVREMIKSSNILRRQKMPEFTIQLPQLQQVVQKIKAFLTQIRPFTDALRQQQAKMNAANNKEGGNNANGAASGAADVKEERKASAAADGKPSGHGAPVYAAPSQQANLNLKLPEKKRKAGSATSPSPAPEGVAVNTKQGDEKAALRPQPAQMIRQPSAPPDLPHKCPIPTCHHHLSGFGTQAEADQHAVQEHNYSGNALNWMLDNMKKLLCLGGDDVKVVKSGNGVNGANGAKVVAARAISQGQAGNTSVGMSRTATNATLKAPQAAELRIQQGLIKAGSPDGAATSIKRTVGAIDEGSAQGTSPKKVAISFEDTWTAALVTREAIHDVFSDLEGITDVATLGFETTLPPPPAVAEVVAEEQTAGAEEVQTPVAIALPQGLPSPPPVTWGDTPDSATSNKEPADSRATTTAPITQPLSEWNPFGANGDETYNIVPDEINNKFMDWTDSGLGMDSFDFDPQDMASQIYLNSIPQDFSTDSMKEFSWDEMLAEPMTAE